VQERIDGQSGLRFENDEKYYSKREAELRNYRNIIQTQEDELNTYRAKLKEEIHAREQEFQKELESREQYFIDREKKLLKRQHEFEEQANIRHAEISELKSHLQKEISQKELSLKQAYFELEQERERLSEESRQKLQRNSNKYVEDALTLLSSKEENFHFLSKVWATVGAVSLIVGVIFFVIITYKSSVGFGEGVSWQFLLFLIFKGVIAVGLLAAVSKYSYMFSRSYMHESLKNADRRHAINFGKFYLESYGATAEWNEVKDAFEHWNINGDNAFTSSLKSPPPSNDEISINSAKEILQKVELAISHLKGKA
jgi:hypothetical protein